MDDPEQRTILLLKLAHTQSIHMNGPGRRDMHCLCREHGLDVLNDALAQAQLEATAHAFCILASDKLGDPALLLRGKLTEEVLVCVVDLRVAENLKQSSVEVLLVHFDVIVKVVV